MVPTVDVLGKPYVVVSVEREEGDYGECFTDQCRIEIATYQCTAQKRDTLLHEIVHAIEAEMQLAMKERQVRLLSTGLLDVLRRNPALVAFLTET